MSVLILPRSLDLLEPAVSVRVMSWVWENSTSVGADRLVLLAIADAANDAGRDAYPGMGTLAKKANVDKRTAQRSVRALAAAGAITVAENAGPKGTHRYTVHMTGGRQDTTPASHHPGDTPPRQDTTGDTPRGVASDPERGGETPPEPSITHPLKQKTTTSVTATRPDVERICAHLADRIQANGSKRPRVTPRWRSAARLLLDADERTEQQVHNAIDWCQDDDFWRANVLSMPKLREKYDQLRLSAQRASPNGNGRRSTTNDRVAQGRALAAELRTREQAEPKGITDGAQAHAG